METRRRASSRLRSFPLTYAVSAEELGPLLLAVCARADLRTGFDSLFGCSLFSEPGSGGGMAVSPAQQVALVDARCLLVTLVDLVTHHELQLAFR